MNNSRLEEKTKKFYRNGWRLLKATAVALARIDQITGDCAEQLKFRGSAANANCALRTLRRMLHKAEEWKMIGHAPKIKMMKEHGRHLRLDDDAEKKLIAGAFPPYRHLDARHGNEKRKRTLPNAYRRPRLAKPSDLCARQQDRRRSTTGSDERASLRNSAEQMLCEAGRMGISVNALCVRASKVSL